MSLANTVRLDKEQQPGAADDIRSTPSMPEEGPTPATITVKAQDFLDDVINMVRTYGLIPVSASCQKQSHCVHGLLCTRVIELNFRLTNTPPTAMTPLRSE
jgi:hypothetical protein